MNKLFQKLKKQIKIANQDNEIIENLKLKGWRHNKQIIRSICITVILLIPIFLIIINILEMYANSLFLYKFTNFIIVILFPLMIALISNIYFQLIKNEYNEIQELQTINHHNIFWISLINPISWILGILVVIIPNLIFF